MMNGAREATSRAWEGENISPHTCTVQYTGMHGGCHPYRGTGHQQRARGTLCKVKLNSSIGKGEAHFLLSSCNMPSCLKVRGTVSNPQLLVWLILIAVAWQVIWQTTVPQRFLLHRIKSLIGLWSRKLYLIISLLDCLKPRPPNVVGSIYKHFCIYLCHWVEVIRWLME